MKLKELVHGFHNTIPDSEQILNRLKSIRDTIGGVEPSETTSVPKAGSNFYGAIQELDESVVTHSRIAKEIHAVIGQITQSTGSGYPVRPATVASCPMPPSADPETDWQDGPHINLIDVRSAFVRINSELIDSRDVVDHILEFLAGARIVGGTDSKREQAEGILGEIGAAYSKHSDILEDYSQLLDCLEQALGEGYFLTEEPPKLPDSVKLANMGGVKAFADQIRDGGGSHTVGHFDGSKQH